MTNPEQAEGVLYTELAGLAGVIAKRILAERGVSFLNDLELEASREVLRLAWIEAATTRFAGLDVDELVREIEAMIDSLIMDLPQPTCPDGPAH